MGAKSTTVAKDIAEEAQKRITFAETHTKDLRTRMEEDFALFVLDAYYQSIQKHQRDDNESVTSNSPAVLGNKVIEYLSDGELTFSTKLDANPRKKTRAAISKNELFVYSGVEEAERYWQQVPEHTAILGEHSFNVSILGWAATRVLLYVDKETGTLMTDIVPWCPYNTFWGSGSRGLAWACYRRYASEEEVEELYNVKAKADSYGRVEVLDYWVKGHEYPIIKGADGASGMKVMDDNETHLDHIPVFIRPVGATPLVQIGSRTDAIKHLGESLYVNNRSVYPIENEIATYIKNAIAMGIFTPKVLRYHGPQPKDNPIKGNPYTSNSVIQVPAEIYEPIENFVEPVLPDKIFAFLAQITGWENMGGAAPIVFGDIAQQQTAQGINILSHNALTILKPRKKTIEELYTWAGNEMISQAIALKGSFPKMDIEATVKDKQYESKISPDDLEPSRKVRCELKLHLPQDDELNTSLLVTQLKARIISLQTARDRMGIQDPDAEGTICDREEGREVLGLKYIEMLDAIAEDVGKARTAEDKRRLMTQGYLLKARIDQLYDQLAQRLANGGAGPREDTEAPLGAMAGMMGQAARGGGIRGTLPRRETMPTPQDRLARIGMEMGR